MRFVIAENVWEFLIASLLLVVTIGMYFYYNSVYLCSVKIGSCKSLAKTIFDRINYISNVPSDEMIEVIPCNEMNVTGCEMMIESENTILKAYITCLGCKEEVYEYSLEKPITFSSITLNKNCKYLIIRKNGNNIYIDVKSEKK